jgi:hypothetical protein
LFEPVIIFDASLVVVLDGRFFNTVAHFDFSLNILSITDCLVFIVPMLNVNGDGVGLDVVVF